MKLSVSKEKLLQGLQTVQNVVSTRTTLPILSNVLLEAADGQLKLTTTDLDVGIRGGIEATVEKPGSATLPARRLFTIMEKVLEEVSFGAEELAGTTVVIDAAYVGERLGDLVRNQDLRRYVL